MPAPQSDLLQGTLDLLILKALTLQDLHGMGVSRRIAQITGGAFDVKPGSLFPALHRMEQAGWLTPRWGESETNRRAKFYALTKAGKKQLLTASDRWERISLAMATAMRTA
jgi:PadR family transcriptional regulator PadR